MSALGPLTRDTTGRMYHGVTQGNGDAKKERVLHTRVPAVLERELKRFADNLRVPVSNLVRTILEDAVSVADAATESVEERLKKAAKHLEKERERIKKKMEHDPLEGVLAFQEVVLAMPARCAKCDKELGRGVRANLAIGESAGHPRRFVCDDCLPRTTTT
jgi:TPP-dependent indolepyruvate ferredoxin oxidoreductase alpha subunit